MPLLAEPQKRWRTSAFQKTGSIAPLKAPHSGGGPAHVAPTAQAPGHATSPMWRTSGLDTAEETFHATTPTPARPWIR